MKNEKGNVILGLALVHVSGAVMTATIFKMVMIAIAAACIWHIPAWEQAKDNHTEAKYQATEQFPQQLFDKLPGGTPGRTLSVVSNGNGGNLTNGIQMGG